MSWVSKKYNWKVVYKDKIIEKFRSWVSATKFITDNNKDYFSELRIEEIE